MHKTGLTKLRGNSGLVNEGVLQQPQVSVAAERIDVLVIQAKYGPKSLSEEGIQRRGARARCASDVGCHVPGIR